MSKQSRQAGICAPHLNGVADRVRFILYHGAQHAMPRSEIKEQIFHLPLEDQERLREETRSDYWLPGNWRVMLDTVNSVLGTTVKYEPVPQ